MVKYEYADCERDKILLGKTITKSILSNIPKNILKKYGIKISDNDDLILASNSMSIGYGLLGVKDVLCLNYATKQWVKFFNEVLYQYTKERLDAIKENKMYLV